MLKIMPMRHIVTELTAAAAAATVIVTEMRGIISLSEFVSLIKCLMFGWPAAKDYFKYTPHSTLLFCVIEK